ncbi:MAG: hydroxymethylbilane synthase [Pseudomonadales bacterium]|nr:hydroxymethylbilane synthase [Pseudomonadales bacterium]MBO6563459.1 hydroxymethylbilane synthase [Pseudomonadales bacterium]MBO6596553.1 hydroxymethylbilane synthase [Pseudomonadales bacterium]MBO6656443.1 hydroxymethylbilane synthase [Pseudomonadales bacterium]MBO6703248.1 hydroxymethylbilane synthase [Pseudomonadales bacterium]
MKTIRIATRESALALWQANHVKTLLEGAHDELTCQIVGMTTEGDRNKVSPLSQMGGKGVFVKELETALFDGSVDIAVHSMKDVPGELPQGLEIAAMVERADPRDAFVSNNYSTMAELPDGARVGSSSLRRVLQLKAAFPGLEFQELRGNVDTRLRKLDEGQYDAIILAVAGLQRLGLSDRVADAIHPKVSIPAAGQGAVGIECRAGDESTKSLLTAINHPTTWHCVSAEREVTLMLGATCNLPIAVFAEISEDTLQLAAYVSDTQGSQVIREHREGPVNEASALAKTLGQKLLDQGAAALIESS